MLLQLGFKIEKAPSSKQYSLIGFAQGTTYAIKYISTKEVVSKLEIDSIFAIFNHSLSRYDKSSLLYKLNKPKYKAAIDSHLYKVLTYAQEMHAITNECFDYRLFPLMKLWGFGRQNKNAIPDTQKVIKLLEFIKSNDIKINQLNIVKSSKRLELDLDGIAQGYCVDQLSNFLKQRGVRNYIIELGGEVFVSGTNAGYGFWEIGLGDTHEQFDQKNQELILSGMDQMAVTTSGNLQKYKKIGDQYFSHIIDPRTGYPVQNGIVSVTVIAPTAMQADALDNALMVMGIKESFEWSSKYSNIGFYISYINPNGELKDTANGYFKQFLKTKTWN